MASQFKSIIRGEVSPCLCKEKNPRITSAPNWHLLYVNSLPKLSNLTDTLYLERIIWISLKSFRMRVLCRISSLIVFSGALASVCRANSQNNGDFHSTHPSSSFENSPFARGGATRSPRSSKEKRDNEFSFPEDTRQPNFPIVPPFIRKSFTSQRQRNLNYKDILECTSPQVRWPDENNECGRQGD